VRLEWDKDEAGVGASLRLDRYVIAIQQSPSCQRACLLSESIISNSCIILIGSLLDYNPQVSPLYDFLVVPSITSCNM